MFDEGKEPIVRVARRFGTCQGFTIPKAYERLDIGAQYVIVIKKLSKVRL
jgi:hypothetical protein